MATVIVFGPTGQVGSVAALTAADHGADVWLAMRDTTKHIPGLSDEREKQGRFRRIHADLQQPETVSRAVAAAGATRAFIYLVHGAPDHLKGAITAMRSAGVEFVVFLSSFTILLDRPFRDVDRANLLPYIHGQVEANLDDVFGADHYVAVRPGCFVTNLLSEKDGIVAGDVKLYGGEFEQDNISPSDIGRTVGTILVSGPKNGQQKVYLYGPEVLSVHDSIVKIGKILGKDLVITALDATAGYEKYLSSGMPDAYAKFMVDTLGTKGPDKGNGERFPRYDEGVSNVELYTGRPSTSLEEWVQENRGIFRA